MTRAKSPTQRKPAVLTEVFKAKVVAQGAPASGTLISTRQWSETKRRRR